MKRTPWRGRAGGCASIRPKVIERAKAAAATTERAVQEPAPDDDRPRPYVTKGGVYVDPRGVRDRSKPEVAYVPQVRGEPLPALPPPAPIPGVELADAAAQVEADFFGVGGEAGGGRVASLSVGGNNRSTTSGGASAKGNRGGSRTR